MGNIFAEKLKQMEENQNFESQGPAPTGPGPTEQPATQPATQPASNSFLPDDYEPPAGGGDYLKFKKENTLFRILTSPLMFNVGWTHDNKPVRQVAPFTPQQAATFKDKAKHAWALVVYSYEDKKLMVLELTQVGIINALTNFARNPSWGDPKGYDINVHKKGEGLDTDYTVMPSPPAVFNGMDGNTLVAELSKIDLSRLLTGDDPFIG